MSKGWAIFYRVTGVLISFYAYMFLFTSLAAMFSGVCGLLAG